MLIKRCPRCQQTKSIEEFYKNRSMKDGCQSYCKLCRREYRYGHPEYQKKYQQSHRKTVVIYSRRWQKNHPYQAWAIMTLCKHRKKGYIVDLTPDQIVALLNKNPTCQICGKILTIHKDKAAHDSPTLDRMNNEQHMNLTNVLILCQSCNRAKGKKPLQQFLEQRRKAKAGVS